MQEKREVDRVPLGNVVSPSSRHDKITRRDFLITALGLAGIGSTFFAACKSTSLVDWFLEKIFGEVKHATPLPVRIIPKNGEPQVEVLKPADEVQVAPEQAPPRNLLAELTSKEKPSRKDLLEVLSLDYDPITKYANDTAHQHSHIFSPIASSEPFVDLIASETDPVRKVLMAIAFSGMSGNYDPNELSPFIWANEFNKADSDEDGIADNAPIQPNKCNTYAQYIAQLITHINGETHPTISHYVDATTKAPLSVTSDNIDQTITDNLNGIVNANDARSVSSWLETEEGGKKCGWKKLETLPSDRSELANSVLYVARFEISKPLDGHNFVVFFDTDGNAYKTQSTYNTMVEKLDKKPDTDILSVLFSNPEFHFYSHKIVP